MPARSPVAPAKACALEMAGPTSRAQKVHTSFFGKRRTALKVLFYDGTGMCIFYKRLDQGTFRVPESQSPDATSVVVDERVLDALLDGIDVEAPSAKRSRGPKTRVH